MRRFADYGELKKAALMLTAFQLGREEITQLKVPNMKNSTEEIVRILHALDGTPDERAPLQAECESSSSMFFVME